MKDFETDIKEVMARHKITSALCAFVLNHKDNVVLAMVDDEIDLVLTGLSLLIANAPEIFVVQQQVIFNIFIDRFMEMKNKHAAGKGGGILDQFDIDGVKPS